MRKLGAVALVAGLLLLATGCMYTTNAARNYANQPQPVPWWCGPDGGVDLNATDCQFLSLQLDSALAFAHAHPHASDAVDAGAFSAPYESGTGARFQIREPTPTFDAAEPHAVLYDGTDDDAQIVGLEWNVTGASAPEGFVGPNDSWVEDESVWTVRAWIVRPFENQPDVFATTHPCLVGTEATYDLGATCYLDSHPAPLEILVTNDDGYENAGIAAVVYALIGLPHVNVTVVAPLENQSGTGDQTSPEPPDAIDVEIVRPSHSPPTSPPTYPATAVDGFPADSVLHALNEMGLNPDLVVSGINDGQNTGPFVDISGTVGAARTAARKGIPALASSQGFGRTTPTVIPPDFPTGASAVLAWVEDFRLGRAGEPYQTVANLNIPTCYSGAVRGTIEVPVAADFSSGPFNPSNCESTATGFVDDVGGFANGFITLSDAELN
jgi:5'-nucleotidase